jgi:hypothetical protein
MNSKSTHAKTQLWQESVEEHAITPTETSTSRGETRVFLDPVSPTKNTKILSYHEKLYYYSNLKQAAQEASVVKGSRAMLKPTEEYIQYGHEVSVKAPPPEVFESYIRGNRPLTSPPLRVITFQKRGTKHPRVASGHSAIGISRNNSGGFYNS